MMKRLLIFLSFIFLSNAAIKAQYNPYLEKKKKHRPAAIMARQEARNIKKGKKAYKKQVRRSKRRVNRKKR